MRLNITLTSFLLCCSLALGAQNLTGIWRGYFGSSNSLYKGDTRQEMYKYEVQIDQQSNNALKGVTYSYQSTVFYGKATLQGIYTVQTKNLILKELALEELKITDKSEPCLMTCYLEYSKMGNLEVLQGTFISINAKSKVDCGSGKVYLERVKDTDFELEPFLAKRGGFSSKRGKDSAKPPITVQKKTPATKPLTNPSKDNTVKTPAKTLSVPPATKKPATVTPSPIRPGNNSTTQKKPVTKPATNIPKNTPKTTPAQKEVTHTTQPPATTNWKQDATINNRKIDTPIVKWEQPSTQKGPIPKVLLERENNLIKTIYTHEQVATVEIFDNGTIDNDTISLYHNNKLVISHAKLTYTPLRLKIDCSGENKRHELIMVAENLGEIPPNSALMVITAGKKRYEVFLVSNEQRNAKVVIEYKSE
ncbi:MAG: hypothetical protein IBJ16_07105 [Chitinophagaceae bacterium]|nr:hypothetical protein [Chitinophagaceae bacterium]